MRAAVAAAVGSAVAPGDSAEVGGCCFRASAKENCLQKMGKTYKTEFNNIRKSFTVNYPIAKS
jgi:hypothetical protein